MIPPGWRKGLPPGELYPDMVHDYEACPTPMGWIHRKRSEQDAVAHKLAAGEAKKAAAFRALNL